jgi:plastocyanin
VVRRLVTTGLTTLFFISAALVPHITGAQEVQTIGVSIIEPEGGAPADWAYAPADVIVAVGTPVTWTNSGAQPHTVTADDGVSFDSGNLDSQVVFSITPESPGIFSYHCTYHPWMTATLTVTN